MGNSFSWLRLIIENTLGLSNFFNKFNKSWWLYIIGSISTTQTSHDEHIGTLKLTSITIVNQIAADQSSLKEISILLTDIF